LSVQDFLNDIKALSNNDGESDEEASRSENDEDEVVGVATTIGFARALFKIRTITKKISSSTIRSERFVECCKTKKLTPLQMLYDVSTRWDSAFNMLSRALYLQKAIEAFLDDDDNNLGKFKLSKKEWQQAHLVATILLPFKKASIKLQSTNRPSIDSVFWTYESLFNKIDAIKATFSRPEYSSQDWIQELHIAVEAMSNKLSKHYTETKHAYVYPDSVILEPRRKLMLFKQDSFGGGDKYAERYKKECRDRYMQSYENSVDNDMPNASEIRKRKCDDLTDDEDKDDYRKALNQYASQAIENEFDRYLNTPPPPLHEHISTLEWWKQHNSILSRLALMARDTFAVLATGAGIERMFSKSGRVASWTRSRLAATTIMETMVYKDYLNRTGKPLDMKAKNHGTKGTDKGGDPDEIEEETEEERIALIKWEKQWWQKIDANIRV
jgi:hypothetical protein